MRAWVLIAVLVPLLSAGKCGPGGPPDEEETCTLACEFGFKADISGATYCECRLEQECNSNRPAPFVNPETGVCTGFPTDCDIPTGWSVCPQCTADACGPSPGIPDRLCSDGTVAGATCSRHEDGMCAWSVLGCPEDGEVCNQSVCGPGFGCCNWSCSACAPSGGSCTQQACDDAI